MDGWAGGLHLDILLVDMATKKTLVKCQILDIAKVPGSRMQLVSIEFSIGKRVWRHPIKIEYDRPISFEEFKRELTKHAQPPEDSDFLAFVKEEATEPFYLEIERDLPDQKKG